MSTDEIDLIYGRLTRESKELEREIAALKVKLGELTKQVTEALQMANATRNEPPVFVTPVADALNAIVSMPDKQAILDTLQELESRRNRLSQVKASLTEME